MSNSINEFFGNTSQPPVIQSNEPYGIEVNGKVAAYDNGKIRVYSELLDGTLGLHLGDKVKIVIVPIKED